MREVLEDARLVSLQKEGGTSLARLKKEEFRFPQSEDYRYRSKRSNFCSTHCSTLVKTKKEKLMFRISRPVYS